MSAGAETPASIGLRVAAGSIDLTLLLLAALLITWLGIEIQAAVVETRAELMRAMTELWRDVLLVATVMLALAAMTLSWTRFGATPGQLLAGCRVRRRGQPVRLNVFLALWRAAATLMLAAPTGLPLLTMFLHPSRRAAHDWMSDSVVVEEDESLVPLEAWMSELG